MGVRIQLEDVFKEHPNLTNEQIAQKTMSSIMRCHHEIALLNERTLIVLNTGSNISLPDYLISGLRYKDYNTIKKRANIALKEIVKQLEVLDNKRGAKNVK